MAHVLSRSYGPAYPLSRGAATVRRASDEAERLSAKLKGNPELCKTPQTLAEAGSAEKEIGLLLPLKDFPARPTDPKGFINVRLRALENALQHGNLSDFAVFHLANQFAGQLVSHLGSSKELAGHLRSDSLDLKTTFGKYVLVSFLSKLTADNDQAGLIALRRAIQAKDQGPEMRRALGDDFGKALLDFKVFDIPADFPAPDHKIASKSAGETLVDAAIDEKQPDVAAFLNFALATPKSREDWAASMGQKKYEKDVKGDPPSVANRLAKTFSMADALSKAIANDIRDDKVPYDNPKSDHRDEMKVRDSLKTLKEMEFQDDGEVLTAYAERAVRAADTLSINPENPPIKGFDPEALLGKAVEATLLAYEQQVGDAPEAVFHALIHDLESREGQRGDREKLRERLPKIILLIRSKHTENASEEAKNSLLTFLRVRLGGQERDSRQARMAAHLSTLPVAGITPHKNDLSDPLPPMAALDPHQTIKAQIEMKINLAETHSSASHVYAKLNEFRSDEKLNSPAFKDADMVEETCRSAEEKFADALRTFIDPSGTPDLKEIDRALKNSQRLKNELSADSDKMSKNKAYERLNDTDEAGNLAVRMVEEQILFYQDILKAFQTVSDLEFHLDVQKEGILNYGALVRAPVANKDFADQQAESIGRKKLPKNRAEQCLNFIDIMIQNAETIQTKATKAFQANRSSEANEQKSITKHLLEVLRDLKVSFESIVDTRSTHNNQHIFESFGELEGLLKTGAEKTEGGWYRSATWHAHQNYAGLNLHLVELQRLLHLDAGSRKGTDEAAELQKAVTAVQKRAVADVDSMAATLSTPDNQFNHELNQTLNAWVTRMATDGEAKADLLHAKKRLAEELQTAAAKSLFEDSGRIDLTKFELKKDLFEPDAPGSSRPVSRTKIGDIDRLVLNALIEKLNNDVGLKDAEKKSNRRLLQFLFGDAHPPRIPFARTTDITHIRPPLPKTTRDLLNAYREHLTYMHSFSKNEAKKKELDHKSDDLEKNETPKQEARAQVALVSFAQSVAKVSDPVKAERKDLEVKELSKLTAVSDAITAVPALRAVYGAIPAGPFPADGLKKTLDNAIEGTIRALVATPGAVAPPLPPLIPPIAKTLSRDETVQELQKLRKNVEDTQKDAAFVGAHAAVKKGINDLKAELDKSLNWLTHPLVIELDAQIALTNAIIKATPGAIVPAVALVPPYTIPLSPGDTVAELKARQKYVGDLKTRITAATPPEVEKAIEDLEKELAKSLTHTIPFAEADAHHKLISGTEKLIDGKKAVKADQAEATVTDLKKQDALLEARTKTVAAEAAPFQPNADALSRDIQAQFDTAKKLLDEASKPVAKIAGNAEFDLHKGLEDFKAIVAHFLGVGVPPAEPISPEKAENDIKALGPKFQAAFNLGDVKSNSHTVTRAAIVKIYDDALKLLNGPFAKKQKTLNDIRFTQFYLKESIESAKALKKHHKATEAAKEAAIEAKWKIKRDQAMLGAEVLKEMVADTHIDPAAILEIKTVNSNAMAAQNAGRMELLRAANAALMDMPFPRDENGQLIPLREIDKESGKLEIHPAWKQGIPTAWKEGLPEPRKDVMLYELFTKENAVTPATIKLRIPPDDLVSPSRYIFEVLKALGNLNDFFFAERDQKEVDRFKGLLKWIAEADTLLDPLKMANGGAMAPYADNINGTRFRVLAPSLIEVLSDPHRVLPNERPKSELSEADLTRYESAAGKAAQGVLKHALRRRKELISHPRQAAELVKLTRQLLAYGHDETQDDKVNGRLNTFLVRHGIDELDRLANAYLAAAHKQETEPSEENQARLAEMHREIKAVFRLPRQSGAGRTRAYSATEFENVVKDFLVANEARVKGSFAVAQARAAKAVDDAVAHLPGKLADVTDVKWLRTHYPTVLNAKEKSASLNARAAKLKLEAETAQVAKTVLEGSLPNAIPISAELQEAIEKKTADQHLKSLDILVTSPTWTTDGGVTNHDGIMTNIPHMNLRIGNQTVDLAKQHNRDLFRDALMTHFYQKASIHGAKRNEKAAEEAQKFALLVENNKAARGFGDMLVNWLSDTQGPLAVRPVLPVDTKELDDRVEAYRLHPTYTRAVVDLKRRNEELRLNIDPAKTDALTQARDSAFNTLQKMDIHIQIQSRKEVRGELKLEGAYPPLFAKALIIINRGRMPGVGQFVGNEPQISQERLAREAGAGNLQNYITGLWNLVPPPALTPAETGDIAALNTLLFQLHLTNANQPENHAYTRTAANVHLAHFDATRDLVQKLGRFTPPEPHGLQMAPFTRNWGHLQTYIRTQTAKFKDLEDLSAKGGPNEPDLARKALEEYNAKKDLGALRTAVHAIANPSRGIANPLVAGEPSDADLTSYAGAGEAVFAKLVAFHKNHPAPGLVNGNDQWALWERVQRGYTPLDGAIKSYINGSKAAYAATIEGAAILGKAANSATAAIEKAIDDHLVKNMNPVAFLADITANANANVPLTPAQNKAIGDLVFEAKKTMARQIAESVGPPPLLEARVENEIDNLVMNQPVTQDTFNAFMEAIKTLKQAPLSDQEYYEIRGRFFGTPSLEALANAEAQLREQVRPPFEDMLAAEDPLRVAAELEDQQAHQLQEQLALQHDYSALEQSLREAKVPAPSSAAVTVTTDLLIGHNPKAAVALKWDELKNGVHQLKTWHDEATKSSKWTESPGTLRAQKEVERQSLETAVGLLERAVPLVTAHPDEIDADRQKHLQALVTICQQHLNPDTRGQDAKSVLSVNEKRRFLARFQAAQAQLRNLDESAKKLEKDFADIKKAADDAVKAAKKLEADGKVWQDAYDANLLKLGSSVASATAAGNAAQAAANININVSAKSARDASAALANLTNPVVRILPNADALSRAANAAAIQTNAALNIGVFKAVAESAEKAQKALEVAPFVINTLAHTRTATADLDNKWKADDVKALLRASLASDAKTRDAVVDFTDPSTNTAIRRSPLFMTGLEMVRALHSTPTPDPLNDPNLPGRAARRTLENQFARHLFSELKRDTLREGSFDAKRPAFSKAARGNRPADRIRFWDWKQMQADPAGVSEDVVRAKRYMEDHIQMLLDRIKAESNGQLFIRFDRQTGDLVMESDNFTNVKTTGGQDLKINGHGQADLLRQAMEYFGWLLPRGTAENIRPSSGVLAVTRPALPPSGAWDDLLTESAELAFDDDAKFKDHK